MQHVDPPDLTLWPTLRHLYPLWRAQWRLVILGLVCALVFTGLSLAIPILIQRTIDNAIDGGDTALLLPYLGLITVIAALRFGVNFTRRYATARIGIAVEARLRGMMYDAYLRFPARVLRPPRDGRGDLARHERHLPGALLHRLGRRAGDPERDDADRRRDRAHVGERPADALRRARDAADRGADLRLRAQGVPDLARRAGEEGPPDGGHGRGGRRDRDGAGVRPRGRRSRALRRPRRGRARRDDAAGGHRGALPARADLPALARHRRRPLLRRPRRDRRDADDRPVHALHHPAAAARLAARGARLDHQPRPAGDGGRVALVRLARLDRAARRARAAGAPPGRAADDPDGGRPLQLRHRQRGALGRRPRGRAGRDRRRLRRHRRRQDIAPEPAAALLRPDRRTGADRRRRQPRRRARRAAAVGRARDAEARAVLGAAARQPARRPPRRRLGRRAGRVRGGRRGGVRRRAARRLRHADRRARRQPLGRPAPARRARARAHRARPA